MVDKLPVKLGGTDYTQIFIAVFVIVITLVLIALYKRRKSTRRGILFTGICDSGKTLLFSQLIHNKHIQTHTSIKENISNYIFNGDALKVIDIPGHERLRDRFFSQYKDIAKGIVFVVDSNTITQDIRDAAEFLYNIIVDPVIVKNKPNILILCNKQDFTFAKGGSAVKSIFEKELHAVDSPLMSMWRTTCGLINRTKNTLRTTKSSQLESVDPKVKKASLLGDSEEDFDFGALSLKVDIAESYAYHKNGSVDIEGLKKWLSRQI